MKKAIIVYLAALLVILPKCAQAFEYEVDMPSSVFGKYHMICIKINNCDTFFKMTDKDFTKQMNGDLKLDTAKMVKVAIERERVSCPKTQPEPISIQREN